VSGGPQSCNLVGFNICSPRQECSLKTPSIHRAQTCMHAPSSFSGVIQGIRHTCKQRATKAGSTSGAVASRNSFSPTTSSSSMPDGISGGRSTTIRCWHALQRCYGSRSNKCEKDLMNVICFVVRLRREERRALECLST
jgi:hypothetical protein